MNNFSIAIDGPAGAGKSSIAKELARSLNCIYIDTGAMYRSVGFYCISHGIDYLDETSVNGCLEHIQLRLALSEEGQQIFLNEENVSLSIRNDAVAAAASKVATYEAVRCKMVNLQQQMAIHQSVVMDGRDIGTVVLPHATLKVFLTATVEERANRRYKEYIEKGYEADLQQLKNEIIKRDEQDTTRLISPLKKAEDAIEIDTSDLTIEEIVNEIMTILRQRI